MRTKIIATIGPASESPEKLRALIENGMHIARLNFSHATVEQYKRVKDELAEIDQELGTSTKILADLQGPRMRVGTLPGEGRMLKEGETVVFTTAQEESEGEIHIDNPYLHLDIQVNDPLYLANGDIECVVTSISDRAITTEVLNGGRLFSNKGVNTPHTELRIAGLTDKDREDAKNILKEGCDYMAISFVQGRDHVESLRELVGDKVHIVSKIETGPALKNIEEILDASDSIMIARGDLGIEIPRERVPFVQKHLINNAILHSKPAITATQMLSSMMENQVPTRAEVSDVANAVWDGTDAVMLSDETAVGKHPIEAVEMMHRCVAEAERVHYQKDYSL